MALRINTNIAALSAHKNMIKNDNGLSASLEKLSSGLRINKAADDASGMAIADSLKSQALGLGQAVRNANDGISMVQTADGALDESINIVNTIKTKAIQSAQDGQTIDSRKAIQADINKLLEELDAIAKTTAFNGQKLLSGQFTNKKFQIGAYAQETVNISIGSSESTKIGHVAASELTFAGEGTAELDLYSNIQNATYSIAPKELLYDNTRENSLGALADSINQLSDKLGISADASVVLSTNGRIQEGTTGDFTINGVTISSLSVQNNDANGALVASINQKTDQHGVYASIDQNGYLTLTSTDDRAISVNLTAEGEAVFGNTTSEEMSSFGKITLTQTGAGDILVSDRGSVTGVAVSVADGFLNVDSGLVSGSTSSLLTAGTVLASGTVFGSGTVMVGTFKTAEVTSDSGFTSVIGAGSILLSGTVIGSGATLTAATKVEAAAATVEDGGILTAGTVLAADTILVSGSVLVGDMTTFISGSDIGSVVYSGGFTYVASGTASVKAGGMTLTGTGTFTTGLVIESGSTLAAGSSVLTDLTTLGKTTLGADMTLVGGSTIASGSTMTTGSTFGGVAVSGVGNGLVSGDMTLKAASIIAGGSKIANGSTLSTSGSMLLAADETVGAKKMVLAAGSYIESGSILKAGTVLTNDIVEQSGAQFNAGTVLTRDIEVDGTSTAALTADGLLANAMILESGSLLKAGTTLGDNAAAASNTVETTVGNTQSYRLSDVDVTTQEGAQIGIAVSDAALKSLDKVRSDLGSVQNQLNSTIANLSTTRVNISSAESSIRDVDFAEESATFSKMRILTQASTFAMAQANASSQNVLSLLQG